jgi:DNA (cytosine-5)-methyltransferase 1
MKKTVSPHAQLKAIDFFCGAGGMSYGLKRAGISVVAGIDVDADCEQTYVANIRGAEYLCKDITKLTCLQLQQKLKITIGDDSLVFAGCSPCQYWSKIHTDKSKSQKSAFLLKAFQKFIRYFRPGFVLIENVPGLMTNKRESILPSFLKFLKRHGYSFDDGIINSNHYGVPQNRFRYVLVATRLSVEIKLPKARTDSGLIVRKYLGIANGFKEIKAGTQDKTSFHHTAASLSKKNLERISITKKDGGDRSAWKDNADLMIPAYEGNSKIFKDVYARMYWDRPAPTITTRFNSFSNGRFGHPEEDRAISLREGATLQTFPKSYRFITKNKATIARHIGNAVPPALAENLGQQLIRIFDGQV